MTYMPLEAGSDLATKRDLDALEARLDERFAHIDSRFAHIDGRFEVLDQRLFSLHESLTNQYKSYSITMVGGMSALTAIYAGLLAILALAT